VLVLLGTASRASLLGALVEVLLVLLVSWPAPLRALRRRGARWLGVTLLAVVLVVGIASFSRRFALPTQSATLGARRVIWEQSLKMIRARPWGYGLEAMGIASPRFRQRELNTVESLTMELDRAHSKPLDLLISLGPLGFLGYYAFLVLLFVSLWRRRRTDRFAPPSFLALVGASIALLFGFDTVVTHAFFWLIAGMALGSMAPPAVSPPSKRVRLLLGVLLGVLSVATVFFAVWALARIDLERSDQYLARGDTASSVRAAVSAAASFPFDRSILLRAVERSLLAEERAEDERSEGLLEAVVSLELRRLSTLTSGEDGAILLLRAWQAGLRGNASEAEQLLDRALAVEPTSVTAYSIAAHVERLLGNEGKRAQVIRQLLTLLPPWWQDRASPLGRILWKENPWLTELLPSAPRLRLP
jgi:hypothetical protein